MAPVGKDYISLTTSLHSLVTNIVPVWAKCHLSNSYFYRFHLSRKTLVRLIMTGNIVVGKNNGGYKYGGIAKKPPILNRHYFTCNIIFTKKIVNPILQNSTQFSFQTAYLFAVS